MPRFAMKVEYDGTNFSGWQIQAQERTVQHVVENAVQKSLGVKRRIPVHASGRTDTGVHAAGQVAHFDSSVSRPAETLIDAVNYWLPSDVSVLCLRDVPPTFHARFSPSFKLYRYRILTSTVPHPLRERFTYRVYDQIELSPMKACARRFLGIHNFASFTSSGSSVQSTVRRVVRSEWTRHHDELRYFVKANGFTYNMVRALVGTMLEAGKGKIYPANMDDIIRAKDRRMAGPTINPSGLMLMHVEYRGSDAPFEAE